MASSGKKGKKSKGKTVPLTDFLQESSGIASVPVKKFNWSDEVEDALESGGYESRPKATNVFLPTAPRAARGPDISDDRIPNKPPFIAYISNLPYDVDEEEIIDFFSNFMVCSLRLPRDDRGGEGGRLKGFGYVEFEDRATLIEAISIGDTNMKGRRIKIDVAASSDADRRRGGRMDMGRDRPERPEVSMGDWRSGPRTDPAPESRGGGGGGGFNRDRSDRDRDREGAPDTNRAGAWRDSTDRPSFRDNDRDRGFSRDGDRSERSFNRDGDRDRGGGGGGYRDGGGFSDRGRYGDRDRDGDRRGGGFGSRRYGGDREGYDRERGESDFRRGPREDSAPSERDQPRSRPKLNLAPRTKPIEEQAPLPSADEQEEQASAAPAPAPVPAASIFGAAKPVDTSARERQIEERLEKEKEVRPAARDSSRDNKSRDDDEERPPKREAWGRKRNDDQEEAAPRKESPERRPSSRGPPPARRDEKKTAAPRDRAPPRKEEKPPARKEEKVPRDNHDREMPKLKEPEPPNFAQSNIFASLEAEGEVSD